LPKTLKEWFWLIVSLCEFCLFLIIPVLEFFLINSFFFNFSQHERYLLFCTWLFTKFIIKNFYILVSHWRVLIHGFRSIIMEFFSRFWFLLFIIVYYKFSAFTIFLIYYSIPFLIFLNLPHIVDAIKLEINNIISFTIANLREFGKTLDLGELLLKLILLTFFMYYFFKKYLLLFIFYWITKLTLTFLIVFESEIFKLKSSYREKWINLESSEFTNQKIPLQTLLTLYTGWIILATLLFLFDMWRMRISFGFWIFLLIIVNPNILARLPNVLPKFKTTESKIITSLYLIYISACFIYRNETPYYEIITNFDWESILTYGDIRAESLNNLFPNNTIRFDLWNLFWGYYVDIYRLWSKILWFLTYDPDNFLLIDPFIIHIPKVLPLGPDFNIILCIGTINMFMSCIPRTSKYSLHFNNIYSGCVFWLFLDFIFFDRFLWTFFLLWLYIVVSILIKGGNTYDDKGDPIPANRLWTIFKVTGMIVFFFFWYGSIFSLW